MKRKVKIKYEKNRLYQFMKTVNNFLPENDRLTARELEILHSCKLYDADEINAESKDRLMDDFRFSSKTQVGSYISILFKKKAIFRSPDRSWVYFYNPYFFPPSGENCVKEIILEFDEA